MLLDWFELNTPLIQVEKVESLQKENLSRHHMHCFSIETTKTFQLLLFELKKKKSENTGGKRYSTFEANREQEWYTYIIPQFIFIHEFVR